MAARQQTTETDDVPDGVSCKRGLHLRDHLHIKMEEDELWETDIMAVTVKSEDEEDEAQCSLLHWRKSQENLKGVEPATCSDAKVLKVEPEGDLSEANTDEEETDCSGDWREPLNMNNKGTSHDDAQQPFSCFVCQRPFSRRSNLKKHMLTHTGEKPYVCDVCKKGFSERSNLKIHLRIHTGEKPFSCDLCERKFSRKSSLKTHMLSHTGEKPYFCDVCEKRFTLKGDLNRHVRIHIFTIGLQDFD